MTPSERRTTNAERQRAYYAKNRVAILAREKETRDKSVRNTAKRLARAFNPLQFRARDKERYRETKVFSHIKRTYGLSRADYEVLVEAQKNRCAICQQPPDGIKTRLGVDHDHATGLVRGLLCDRCNIAIGKMGETPTLLIAAAKYLLVHAGKMRKNEEASA